MGSRPYNQAISTAGPTLEKRRSRRREPGHRQLGTVAHQGEALEVKVLFTREIGISGRMSTPSMWPHQTKGQKEKSAGTPRTAGVDSTRRGKAPPLAILFPISHRGEIGPSGASLAGALV